MFKDENIVGTIPGKKKNELNMQNSNININLNNPNTNIEIDLHITSHLLRRTHHRQRQMSDGHLQQQQQGGQQGGYQQRTAEKASHFVPVLTTVGQGREAACTHAQETEVPIDEVED